MDDYKKFDKVVGIGYILCGISILLLLLGFCLLATLATFA